MKKALTVFALLCVALLSVLLINALRFTSRQVQAGPAELPAVDEAGAPQRLAQAIRFRTVSRESAGAASPEELLAFHQYLQQSFPRVHAALNREVVGGYSLLYTWQGSDAVLEPVLLSAHMDVVPVEGATEAQWANPPFAGIISDGYVWGRGALDDKSGVLGLLEAAETLLSRGFRPRRTIYLAFGHDEEIGGKAGAASIAAVLAERGVRLSYALDEGLFIAEGIVPGVSGPVALVGIAEKGYLSLSLTVEAETGHSSAPPPHTAIGILSMAVNRLEENQFPAEVRGIPAQMFDYVGPEMSWGMKTVFANLWLFGPLVKRQLAASPGTNAAIRTTSAVTMIEGGVKDNVLPSRAGAVVNFRILPGDSIESVTAHARAVINDPRVKVEKYGAEFHEPSNVSPVDADEFRVIEKTVRQVFPRAVVAPALVVGATDARHYAKLTGKVYRFLPYRFDGGDIRRLHGTDERLSIENYLQGVRFYSQLILNSAGQ